MTLALSSIVVNKWDILYAYTYICVYVWVYIYIIQYDPKKGMAILKKNVITFQRIKIF